MSGSTTTYSTAGAAATSGDLTSERRTPKERRAPALHAQNTRPKAAIGNTADHLVPIASPHHRPASSSHGRHSTCGPHEDGGASGATERGSRARNQSRSATRQLTAQSTKNASKMSSNASRESTSWSPSKHISTPATS